MVILGIESSCDDTSVALLDVSINKHTILAQKTASQIDVHKIYGGVVPEIAGRKHAEAIVPIIQDVLYNQPKPEYIAVTSGPGLITGLLVGVEVAKTLSYLWNIPLLGINHIEGHIYSPFLEENHADLVFPTLCLIASGGHTEYILMKDHGDYIKIGGTRDDAVGECFDKVAKLLSLDYPGGPKIAALAERGNKNAIPFPRPMIASGDYDMSFSGLKTAALYWLRDNTFEEAQITLEDFCASFQQAIIAVLVKKTENILSKHAIKTLLLGGGVSANTELQKHLSHMLAKRTQPIEFRFPKKKYCMDNAAMIALAGYFHAKNNDITTWNKILANPIWRVINT
ncbi:MAG: tRNA (adenosine(37)-N6)-threonylcarbamoyltransferase complex transferase subunit TsaD [Candidatus Magasanikbacteria bacterium]|nr:tRNA (adenosine(37)-N6)-threonylcarbamoyltransferase complex transferase subunit TsaD [Candidatus Magasanikbacteria bacterium]|tara:strand:- start:865 stop:1887 length:1023 start_codon:yes stop_codon:yes gene_type:complete